MRSELEWDPDILKRAFIELFPEKNIEEYILSIHYTDRFKPYNANVKFRNKKLDFFFSKKWKTISEEIQIGLLQELMLRIFRQKRSTLNIDLYNNFMKHVHIAAPKTKNDPLLEDSFQRLNVQFFDGLLEQPNLVWHTSSNRLGCYEYGSDTISMSTILKEEGDALDYVMYHEMLHKHLKFKCSNGKTRHHTKQFRDMEAKFPNAQMLERKLQHIARKSRFKFRFW